MIGKGATEARPALLSEVEKILEKRQGTGGEFGFEQQTTLEHAKRFAHLKLADAQKMVAELEELGVKKETAVCIANILPKTKPQLALIFARDKTEQLPDKKLPDIEALVAAYSAKARKFEPAKPVEPPSEAAPASSAEEKKP